MKDWSNRKQSLIKIAVFLVVAGVALVVLGNNSSVILSGSSDYRPYSSATNTSVQCSGATSTAIAGASVSRNSFELTASSSDVTLCKSTDCVYGSGLIIEADEFYGQTDEYEGAYSCIGNGVTSTVHTIYSQ